MNAGFGLLNLLDIEKKNLSYFRKIVKHHPWHVPVILTSFSHREVQYSTSFIPIFFNVSQGGSQFRT